MIYFYFTPLTVHQAVKQLEVALSTQIAPNLIYKAGNVNADCVY